ncbi:fimbrial protein [Paraburkholderia metrosideri]|uniref:Fimbrial protein n=1 Tax=Paraburkholderia metrosideri TaxID=580937 RepID=A0ABW9DS79_9BURK
MKRTFTAYLRSSPASHGESQEQRGINVNTTEAKTVSSKKDSASNGTRPVTQMRRRGVWLTRALGAGVLMLGTLPAHADFVHMPYQKGWTDNLDNINFSASLSSSRDVAVGTVLQSVKNSQNMTYTATCPVTKTMTVNGTPVPGMTDTYQTNVPGIGVHFYATSGWGNMANPLISVPATEILSPGTSGSGYPTFYTRADLVVTGAIGNGTLTNLPTMSLSYSGDCIADPNYETPHTLAITAGTTITGRTCSVTTPSVDVALPTAFPSNLNTGSTGMTPFNLGVNCTKGVNVNITLTDASNVSNRSTTLSLAPGSTAGGVGLQILNGSTPIAYGPDSAVAGNLNQWAAGTSAGGAMTIPLKAQYVKTGAVTPGTVKGLATFTMSYQ